MQIVRGDHVLSLLNRPEFAAEWNTLTACCSWATGYQSLGYCRAWYSIYHEKFEPVLVLWRNEHGALRALFPLCRSGANHLFAAGHIQAGYQTWLASDEATGSAFAHLTVLALGRKFRGSQLHLNFLAPGSPMTWLEEPAMRQLAVLQTHQRPLLRFGDGSQIKESLAKKNNRTRMRQLKKFGEVRVEHLTDSKQIHSLFDELMPLYDARHLAIRGVAPFGTDPLFKQFAKSLLDVPGLLHVSALRAGEQLAFAQLSVCGRGVLHMGLSAHNPWMSRQSPGKLHIFLLVQMLMKQGYEYLDLTAGGDAYKERFANDHDMIYSLTMHPSRTSKLMGMAREHTRSTIKRSLCSVGLTPHRLRHAIFSTASLSRLESCRKAMEWARQRVSGKGSDVLVRTASADNTFTPTGVSIRRDSIDDLLACEGSRLKKRQFMDDVIRRCDEGQHVYTVLEGGTLLHYTWVIEQPEKETLDELLPDRPSMMDVTSIVVDMFTAPEARRRGIAGTVMHKLLSSTANAQVAMVVPKHAGLAHSLAAKWGFTSITHWHQVQQLSSNKSQSAGPRGSRLKLELAKT